ncbi:MAG: hypothetical protein LBB88_09470 [Planctomycetaceae bacterium]|nr:hypothetical protein [Planctomycetaceae bacterium]
MSNPFYRCLRQRDLSAKGRLPDLGLFFTERFFSVFLMSHQPQISNKNVPNVP